MNNLDLTKYGITGTPEIIVPKKGHGMPKRLVLNKHELFVYTRSYIK